MYIEIYILLIRSDQMKTVVSNCFYKLKSRLFSVFVKTETTIFAEKPIT